jgi:hypothetical protein
VLSREKIHAKKTVYYNKLVSANAGLEARRNRRVKTLVPAFLSSFPIWAEPRPPDGSDCVTERGLPGVTDKAAKWITVTATTTTVITATAAT